MLPSQLGFPSRSLLNPSHPWALLHFPPPRLLLQRAKTTDLPTQKNAGEFTPSWGDLGHPGRDFGHPGGFWPTQEMLCQRSWGLMGAAFSSWLWGKGDLCHCKRGSDTLPASPKPQPTGRPTGVFQVGCKILGV